MLAPQIPYRIISSGSPKIAAFCTVCRSAIGDMADIDAMERLSCCRECEQQFYEPNREKWDDGWRPDTATILSVRESRHFAPH